MWPSLTLQDTLLSAEACWLFPCSRACAQRLLQGTEVSTGDRWLPPPRSRSQGRGPSLGDGQRGQRGNALSVQPHCLSKPSPSPLVLGLWEGGKGPQLHSGLPTVGSRKNRGGDLIQARGTLGDTTAHKRYNLCIKNHFLHEGFRDCTPRGTDRARPWVPQMQDPCVQAASL